MEAREQAEKKQQEYAEKIKQMQEEMENRQRGKHILVIPAHCEFKILKLISHYITTVVVNLLPECFRRCLEFKLRYNKLAQNTQT